MISRLFNHEDGFSNGLLLAQSLIPGDRHLIIHSSTTLSVHCLRITVDCPLSTVNLLNLHHVR
jgi:hypothetical protein